MLKLSQLQNQKTYTQQTSFKGQNYIEYIAKRQLVLKNKHTPKKYWTLNDFNMKKLEGIQSGLKVLGNLTMTQIKSITERALAIILRRGCNNMCAHCYADARPESFYKKENSISEINIEDFKNFCDDIVGLNNKLGFNIFNKKNKYDYQTLFLDADSSMIQAKDKDGKEYDYLDLSKMLHDSCNKEVLFDTAGWNIQDKKTQNRIDKLVQKFNDNYDKYKFIHFNLSFNPFHSLHYTSIQRKKEGKYDIAEKLDDIYATRMANTINTLLPIFLNHPDNFSIISRSFENFENKNTEGFQQIDLAELYDKTLDKLKNIFYEKFIDEYSEKELDKEFENIKQYFRKNSMQTATRIGITGRLAKRFDYKNFRKTLDEEFPDASDKVISNNMPAGLIDLNGKFYITNYLETFPTNIQLNYTNKDKLTAPINPNLHDHTVQI